MKKLLLALLLLPILCHAQKFIGMDKATLMNYQTNDGAYFDGVKYTTDGIAFLEYSYSLKKMETNDISLEAFYLNDQNICTSYKIAFRSQNSLEYVVNHYKTDTNFVKIPEKFGWYNVKIDCTVQIELKDSGGYILSCAKR
ncbi:hypothetical protein HDF19_11985 [Mucilaginibacter sp. E4BP6]|uniref:hypothetical protein n=1 Tax=Mucilaginibacter sp. E4BP6 TaxID=2723089 RepID=UPI0015C6E437|nr:hypothetical protein [Mucilaginibacter sp. E4BP6]NYE65117.1 hypothetical protein [Mucilaginibacter sp. E4BP6]